MPEKYLSASEAIDALNMPASTFYRLVREDKIKKHYPSPVSKHGLYDPDEIAQLKINFKRENKVVELGGTDWVKGSDMGNIYNLEYRVYGDETGDPSLIRKWYDWNPHMCRVLYNKLDRRDLWGALNMVPLKEETILKLLREEIRDIDLDPQQDILRFDQPGAYDFYVASVIVHPAKKQHFPLLINSVFDFWLEQFPQKTIRRIYGRVVTEDGEMMAKKLFFSPRWDISESAFMLDLTRPNPSRLIQGFQYALKQKSEDVATI